MAVKWILFFVALTAHVWLWGHWNLDAPTSTTLALALSSALLLIYIGIPGRALVNKKNPTYVMRTYWMKALYYAYILSVIFLSLFHFSGLIQILLPIKVALLGVYVFLKYKLKKKAVARQI